MQEMQEKECILLVVLSEINIILEIKASKNEKKIVENSLL